MRLPTPVKRSSTSSLSSTSTLTPSPLTPVTPFNPGERSHFSLPPSYVSPVLTERKHFKIPKIEVESDDFKVSRESSMINSKSEIPAIRYPPAPGVIFSESFPHSPLLSPGLQGMVFLIYSGIPFLHLKISKFSSFIVLKSVIVLFFFSDENRVKKGPCKKGLFTV